MTEPTHRSHDPFLPRYGPSQTSRSLAPALPLQLGTAQQAVFSDPPIRVRRFLQRAVRRDLVASLVLAGLVLVAIAISAWLFPRNFFVFHADWLLHPNEQEHLMISRHFAETGSLVIDDEWFAQSPAHGSEDRGIRDGSLVPRSSIVPYVIFAVPFLISDTAWRFVTPLFGLAAAALAGLIVRRRTGSWLAGAVASLVLLTTASVLLNSGGLALENVIALAFLLGGILLLERLVEAPSIAVGLGTGLMFSLAAGTRLDLAPAGAIVCAVLVARLIPRLRERPSRSQVGATLGAIGVFLAAAVTGMLFNYFMYGNVLSTGYGGNAWQGSASGVTGHLLQFDLGDFKEMAWSFLFRIGKMQTVLLALGIGWLAYRRRARPGDVVLLAVAAWLVVLHLGNDAVTGGSEPYLVNSPPRYLQPVYAAGVLLGIEAVYLLLRALRVQHIRGGLAVAMSAVLLLTVSVSLSEAYGGTWAIPSAQRDAKEFRQVHEFATQNPGAVFVGDYNTKAIITEHTLVPRLLPDPGQLQGYLRAELESGRDVYIVDTPARRDPSNGYYSSYLGRLTEDGLYVSLVPGTPGFLEVGLPTWDDAGIATMLQALPNERTDMQLLANPQLVRAGEWLPGWSSNGNAWFVPRSIDRQDGVRIRNTAQYGGIRQIVPAHFVAGRTVSGFAALRGLAEEGAAQQVLLGLYDGETLEPLVQTVGRLNPDETTYVVFEVLATPDSGTVRFVISSGRYDPGDYVIERVALLEGSLAEVVGR